MTIFVELDYQLEQAESEQIIWLIKYTGSSGNQYR